MAATRFSVSRLTEILGLGRHLLLAVVCLSCAASASTEQTQLDSDVAAVFAAIVKAPNARTFDYFGWSAAISGNHAIVGAPHENNCGTGAVQVHSISSNYSCASSGAAYILVRNSSTGAWLYTAYIKAPNANANDLFGYSVAISGDRALVGAYQENGCGTGVLVLNSTMFLNKEPACFNNSGAAYMLERNSTTGTWSYTAYIKAPSPEAGDEFGSSVAISGDYAVVGALREDGCNTSVLPPDTPTNKLCQDSGAAYLLERNSSTGTWSHVAYIKATNAEADDLFGYSVAISGDRVIVGASGESGCGAGVFLSDSPPLANNSCKNSGAAYLLERNSAGTWSHIAYIKATNAVAGDAFGFSVAVSGDRAIVGANGENGCGAGVCSPNSPLAVNVSCESSGAAYLLERNSSSNTWEHTAYIKAPNAERKDFFGSSVAISGERAIVGTSREGGCGTDVLLPDSPLLANNSCTSSGAAYLLQRNNSTATWSYVAYIKAPNALRHERFGYSVAISGDSVIVGASSSSGCGMGVFSPELSTLAGNNSCTASGAAYMLDAINAPMLPSSATGFTISGISSWTTTPAIKSTSGTALLATTTADTAVPSISSTSAIAFVASETPTLSPSQLFTTATNNSSVHAGAAESGSDVILIVGIAVTSACILVVAVGAFVFLRQKRKPDSQITTFSREDQRDGKELEMEKRLEVQIFEKIGSGNFGSVFRGQWKGETVAAKTIVSGDIAEFEAELAILRRLNHPCIVRYYGLVDLPHGGGSAIVLEYCSGGSLESVLRAGLVPLDGLPSLALQISRGLEYLADEGILHRDLATRNVLHDASGRCKLTDFGLARVVDNGETYMVTSALPVRWSAPEVLAERGFTSQSDVYSLAVTFWEIFSEAATPFAEYSTNSAVVAAVVSGARPPRSPRIPSEVFVLIERCWGAQPADRPSAREVATELAEIIKRLSLAADQKNQVIFEGSSNTAARLRDDYQ